MTRFLRLYAWLRWQWIALCIVGFVLAILIGTSIHAYTRLDSIIFPLSDPTCCQNPTDANFGVKSIQLKTTDRISLACWYLPSHNHAAIAVLHGEGGNRKSMLPHITMLAKEGYGVLTCDRRAHGASTGTQRSWGWLDVNDVEPMLSSILLDPNVDPNRIGVFGFSMGAQVALRAATRYPAIRAVIADGAVPATTGDLFPPASVTEWPRASIDWLDNWFVDRFLEQTLHMSAPMPVVQALAQRPLHPLLLIATGQTGNGRELRQVEWFYNVAQQPKQIWELPDVGHGEGLAKYPSAYSQRIVNFFNSALLERSPANQP
ncbi:alpha/beta fold hydrolase [Tumidithrix elongata RA019]|uniref:Alpha/beta fold hydrolase n=1 Tax=Tumidithrix elongata BACA0141 TaxID=2716417 RepID=A0AAW9Q6M1_9CYAN|nr:alpha/beta fold hydrolase [Tumidithrix elongata RA019]